MKPRRTTSICIEIYETLYKLNPKFRLNVSNRLQREKYKFNLDTPKLNSGIIWF